jgi:outer membrane protein assembly factor BamB
LLPVSADQGTNVPAPFPTSTPATTPAAASQQTPAAASYTSAWTVPFSGEGPLSLTFTSSSLILSGRQIPTEARALDDGRVLWTSKREADTAPVVAGNLLIVPSDGQLVAIDVGTGQDVWAAEYTGAPLSPVVAGDTVFVVTGTSLISRRAADGTPAWSAHLGTNAIAAPAFGDPLVVVALEDRTLAAFDRGTGQPVWRAPNDVTPVAMSVLGDRVYISAAEGYACAHKLEQGRRDWCFPVRVRPIGAPVGDAKQVYFAFLDNMVHVFDRRSGRRYFTPSLDALPAAGPTLTSDSLIVPVVTGEFVLLSLRDRLKPSRVSTPRAAELPSTRAAAVRGDGGALAMVITSAGARYSLVYFNLKPAEEPKQPDEEKTENAPTKIDGTASGTPPAPTAP